MGVAGESQVRSLRLGGGRYPVDGMHYTTDRPIRGSDEEEDDEDGRRRQDLKADGEMFCLMMVLRKGTRWKMSRMI